ncbi:hypothetical protein [Flexivirga endophytica]|uniref:hypothetical protein n=1 Tax=Flexivirga endophytica TaxID=1849103 RepID=UPI001664A13E|nr:hypothetical protein [Flexivirga endophytica]
MRQLQMTVRQLDAELPPPSYARPDDAGAHPADSLPESVRGDTGYGDGGCFGGH